MAALIRSATTEPDKVLRANAVAYLNGCAGPAEQLVPLGLKFLKSDDAYDRWNGARLLKGYLSTREVEQAFQAAAADPDSRVRSLVRAALKNSAPKRKPSTL
jgi:HEAT repeat protein